MNATSGKIEFFSSEDGCATFRFRLKETRHGFQWQWDEPKPWNAKGKPAISPMFKDRKKAQDWAGENEERFTIFA